MAVLTDIIFTNAREGGITAKKLNKLRDDLSAAIGSGGTGAGDMTKAVYDTNSDNVVDQAAAVPWTGITGKPASFAPSAHAASHLDNGADLIPIATTSRTGSLRALNGTATTFLNGTGNWSTPATILWRGVWNATTAYAVNDAVERNGSSYICRVANTGVDPAIGAGSFNIGSTTAGGTSGVYSAITAVQVTLPTSGTLSSISVFSASSGINILLGIYSDGGGVPGTLLASSAVTSCIAGLNTLAIASGPTLTPANYWLVVQGQSNITGYYNSGGSGCWNTTVGWTGTLPTTFTVGGSGAFTFSLYATFASGSSSWDLLAAQGVTGPTGPAGPTGPTGPVGPTGPQGVPGTSVNPGTWTNLTYSTGWTQNTTAQYRVEVNGTFSKVICQGIINYASGAASLAFTLPAGARPGVTRGCGLAGFDSSGDVLLFSANVSTAGAVTILPMVRQAFTWPSATNGSVYLDNLTFAL